MTQLASQHVDDSSSFPSLSDEQLALRAKDGSSASFGALVDRFESRLVTFLFKRLGDMHAAEDIAQEAFVRAWESRGRFNPRWRYSTWLFTIASRRASNHLRRQSRRGTLHLVGEHAGDEGERADVVERDETRSLLWDVARRHLSQAQHTALWLRYGEDMSCQEIARVLGSTSVAVRASLHRARKTLREQIERQEQRQERGSRSTSTGAPASVVTQPQLESVTS
ncbi:MAG: RNA polymerase sigma factor [Planctomycetota bacterium]|jgi:RNA polymerase sigma-70 factor (ECF subfamily)